MSDDFDFLKAFVNVDILKVEAIGEIIGRVTAKLFTGMVAAGMSETDAHIVLEGAMRTMMKSISGGLK